MNEQVSPIFIVGSPRSGTSILTWCLGQHPNILPIEESNWMGKLAFDLASCYFMGSARGIKSHLGSMGITAEMLLEEIGNAVYGLTLRGREKVDRYYAEGLLQDPAAAKNMFRVSRHTTDPKHRWVDGTPEYSLYISPLLKLFPHAKFIHIVRDVQSIVRSLLQFQATGGSPVVDCEQGAYEYWLRTVRSCVEAERAFGSNTVLRMRYGDLVAEPERTLEGCFTFVGEKFCTDCLDPLSTKINSSQVVGSKYTADSRTDPAVRKEAEQLSAQLLSEQKPIYDPDPLAISRMEQAFFKKARYWSRLEANLEAALGRALAAERELQQLRDTHLPERLRDVVCACTEYDSIVAVVSKGDRNIIHLADRMAWHFPRNHEGCYVDQQPADSHEAIAHLEAVRRQGADYLLVPEPSLWWLDHFKEFSEHLDTRYCRIWAREDTAVLYKLDESSLAPVGPSSTM
jgi:hypothetical protein